MSRLALIRTVIYKDSLGKRHRIDEYGIVQMVPIIPGGPQLTKVPLEIAIDGRRWDELDNVGMCGDFVRAAIRWIEVQANRVNTRNS
jgi:hypothetical protein